MNKNKNTRNDFHPTTKRSEHINILSRITTFEKPNSINGREHQYKDNDSQKSICLTIYIPGLLC